MPSYAVANCFVWHSIASTYSNSMFNLCELNIHFVLTIIVRNLFALNFFLQINGTAKSLPLRGSSRKNHLRFTCTEIPFDMFLIKFCVWLRNSNKEHPIFWKRLFLKHLMSLSSYNCCHLRIFCREDNCRKMPSQFCCEEGSNSGMPIPIAFYMI